MLGDVDDHLDSKGGSTGYRGPKPSAEARLGILEALKQYHFFFLAVFSGMA